MKAGYGLGLSWLSAGFDSKLDLSGKNLALPAADQRASKAGPSQHGDAPAVLALPLLVGCYQVRVVSQAASNKSGRLSLRPSTTVLQRFDLLADFLYSEQKGSGKMPRPHSCCKTGLQIDWSPVT